MFRKKLFSKHSPVGMCSHHGFLEDNTLNRGGICRYVLTKTNPDAQADLEKAIAGVNSSIAMLSAFVATGLELSGEMPHKLLHFVVDDHFLSAGIAFASPYVAKQVVKRIAQDRNVELRLLISASESVKEFAALRGLLFEQVAHTTLQRGGSFRFANLESAGSAPNTIQVDKNLKVEIFRTPGGVHSSGCPRRLCAACSEKLCYRGCSATPVGTHRSSDVLADDRKQGPPHQGRCVEEDA